MNKIPVPVIPKRGEYTRLKPCDCCILKGNGRGKKGSMERMDFEDGMQTLANEGNGVWTCAKALWGQEDDKSFKPQCTIAMKEYSRRVK